MKMESVPAFVIMGIVSLFILGCGSSVQTFRQPDAKRLSQYGGILLAIETTSGSITTSGGQLSNSTTNIQSTNSSVNANSNTSSISASHVMSGEKQAFLAGQDVAFRMSSIGLNMVENENQADVIAAFSIGTVRYDPLAGWIADQAFLKFKDKATGKIILTSKASAEFITPTVENLVENLIEQINENK